MLDIYIVKLVVSFIVGSVWITFTTIVADKFGTKLGGAFAGVPSTVVIALFFIGWTQTPITASQSANIVPVIMGVNGLIISVYVILSRYNFYLSISTSILVWLFLSLGLVFLNFDNFIYSLIGYVILLIFSYYVIEKKLCIRSVFGISIKHNFPQLIFRGALCGIMITFAVIMARFGGPLLGGAFASFPILISSTMIITFFAHGREFSCAFLKIIMVSTINAVVFAMAVKYLYLITGLISGTLVSLIISIVSTYLTYILIIRKMT